MYSTAESRQTAKYIFNWKLSGGRWSARSSDTAGDNYYKENFGDNDNYTNDLQEGDIFVTLETGVVSVNINLETDKIVSLDKVTSVFIGPRYPWSDLCVRFSETHSLRHLVETKLM